MVTVLSLTEIYCSRNNILYQMGTASLLLGSYYAYEDTQNRSHLPDAVDTSPSVHEKVRSIA